MIKRGEIALVAGLALLQSILIRFSSSIPSHSFLFLFFFFNMILVPGHLLSRMIIPARVAPVRALFALIFGTAAFFVLLIIFSVLDLDLFYLGAVVPIISLILAIGSRYVRAPEGVRGCGKDVPLAIPLWVNAVLLCLIVFVSALVLIHKDPVAYMSDSADHVAYIRAITKSHEAFPEQFLYKDGGLLTRDIRKGLMHSLWGTMNLLTGRADAAAIWPLISAIASSYTIAAIFCAGLFIFSSPAIGLIAALLFVFIHGGGLASSRLITTAFAFPTGRIFSLVFLFAVFAFLRSRDKRCLIMMAAASFAGTGTHIGHFIVGMFVVFYAAAGRIIEGNSGERREILRKTAPLMAAVTVGVNMPYLLIRYLRDYAPNNMIHSHLQGVFWITDGLYIVNPVTVFLNSGVLGLLVALSVFLLWRHSKNDENLRILLWGVIALWCVLFNPILVPPVMKFMSYLVIRLLSAVPASLVVAVLVKTLWDRSRGRTVRMTRQAAVIGWIAVAICLGYQLAVTPSRFAYTGREENIESGCPNICDVLGYLNGEVPPGGVVASDPLTSYCIPAFTDQFVVCTNDQHSVPNDSTALDRIRDCRDIFSPVSTTREILDVLERYDVDHIVVNGRIPGATGTQYWKPDSTMAMQAIRRFMDRPSLFELVYRASAMAVFRVSPAAASAATPDEEEGTDHDIFGEILTEDDMKGLIPSETPGIFIRSARPVRPSVERGGLLDIDIEWATDRRCPYRAYVAHIRFDTPFEKGPLYRVSYGKIYRKVLERFSGKKYRFRHDHLPLGGLFTPDKWPVGSVIKDRVTLRVPEYIVPGTYDISVRMAISTHYPNYSVRDLLRDDDSYDGPDVARIVIE